MRELFEKNIRFFYQHLPHYYELIKSIKTRDFKIKENNIYQKDKKVFKNSINDSLTFASYPINNPLWQKEFFTLNPSKWDEKKFYITGKIANKLIKKAKSFKEFQEKGFYFDKDFLYTTAIFGTIGKHIEELRKNYEFQSLFIYEPNPELFAISLHFIDYEQLYKKFNQRLFLWVKGEIDYFAIEKFYYERLITSTFLTLLLKTYSNHFIEDAIKKFKEVKEAKLRGWGTYEDEMIGIKNHIKNINKYKKLMLKKELNIPICIVANGKSLENSINFIKKNKNSMIIISVGTAIKPLLKAGIESDFHIEQERNAIVIDALKDILPNYNGYFVGANVVDPEVFKLAKKPLIYFRESFSLSTHFTLKGSSPIVGNAGFAFGANFSNEIYLCGMDLGYKLNQNIHASNSFYDNRNDIAKEGIKVKGNFSDDIYTNSLFLSSKRKIEELIKQKNLKVYNLSDGAYIKGSIPLKDKTLPPIDKEKVKKEILSAFKDIKFDLPKIDLKKILIPVKNTIKKEVKNYKELTGLIDFIEDGINSFNSTPEYALLKGSLSHLLNELYILSHKVSIKNVNSLKNLIAKNLLEFEKDFKYRL
jgi:hypothetical protein